MNIPAKKPLPDPALVRQFVANVERLLDLRRWTYAELAVRMGVYRPVVSRMLEGKNSPSADTIVRVAAAFGVDASELHIQVGSVKSVAVKGKK